MEMDIAGRSARAGIGASYFLGPRGIFRGVDPVKNRAPLEATKCILVGRNILFAVNIRRPLTRHTHKFMYI